MIEQFFVICIYHLDAKVCNYKYLSYSKLIKECSLYRVKKVNLSEKVCFLSLECIITLLRLSYHSPVKKGLYAKFSERKNIELILLAVVYLDKRKQ
jgi:hypothetical protein